MLFRDVIGHNEIKSMLVKGVDRGRVSHAQLFSGASGYGVLPMALAYAQYVNCTSRRDGDSCGECASCIKMAQLAHPDVHFVMPVNSPRGGGGSQKPTSDVFLPQWREIVSQTGGYFDEQMWYRAINIDNQQGLITRAEANEVIRKLSFKSFEADYKVVIVWLPEKMRSEAANGLLKILEEPWKNTLFLMVSEEPAKLLPTILSRMQEVVIPSVDRESVERYLSEKHALTSEKCALLARLSMGDVLEAERLLSNESDETTQEFLELFVNLMRLSYGNKHMELLEWGDSVASLGREEQKRFLEYTIKMLRENYMINAGMDNISYLWGDELDFSRNFSLFIGNHNIESLVSEMELGIVQIGQNGNPRIIFPHLALVVSKLIVKV